jgi:hypothetical protein
MAFRGPPANGPLSTVRPGFGLLGISPRSLEEELKATLRLANEETQNAKKRLGAGRG